MKIATAGIALAAGLLAGLLAGRSTARPKVATPARPDEVETPTGTPDLAGLRTRVADQAAEIRRLTERAEALETAAPAPPDGRRRGLEIFELFRRATARQDGRDYVKALGALDELDESMTAGFIEAYAALKEDDPMRSTGLALILLAGGRDAAAFVVAKLSDPSGKPEERQNILQSIGATSIFMTKRLPYDAAIARVTESLLASPKAEERSGAAGLLAGADTDDARGRLRAMAGSDADPQVRAAAIAALGWNGDRAAMEYLKSYPRQQNQWAVNNALDRALKQLKERFPE